MGRLRGSALLFFNCSGLNLSFEAFLFGACRFRALSRTKAPDPSAVLYIALKLLAASGLPLDALGRLRPSPTALSAVKAEGSRKSLSSFEQLVFLPMAAMALSIGPISKNRGTEVWNIRLTQCCSAQFPCMLHAAHARNSQISAQTTALGVFPLGSSVAAEAQ